MGTLPDEVAFAVVALESGDAATALRLLDAVPARLAEQDAARVGLLRARSLESLGRLPDALTVLEGLAGVDVSPTLAVEVAIVQSRCHREAGEVTRAILVGESALEGLAARSLGGSDEAVQLAVVVAAAYFEQGDRAYALRMCRRALAAADGTGSPRAKAAAYWNCSIMEMERGHATGAIAMARRALALLGEGQDDRNVARLRTQLASMELRMEPPGLEVAARLLEQARGQLRASSAGEIDRWRHHLETARLALLSGDLDRAVAVSLEVVDAVGTDVPTLVADAHATAGQAAFCLGRTEDARAHFRSAVRTLSGVGDDRSVGQLWMDLGGLLRSVGEAEAASDAFQRAGVCAGLSVTSFTVLVGD